MENIIKVYKIVSLKALHQMYNLGDGGPKNCFKLKERLEKISAMVFNHLVVL